MPIFIVSCVIIGIQLSLSMSVDSSFVHKANYRDAWVDEDTQASSDDAQISQDGANIPSKSKKKAKRAIVVFKKRPQVFTREKEQVGFRSGVKFLAKLLDPIDTRFKDPVRIEVTKSLKIDGEVVIEKGSELLGHFSETRNDRVRVNLNRLILASGEEVAVSAVALDPKDYRVGLFGEKSSLKTKKILTSIGLRMLSGMSDVLIERESLGVNAMATPKSTVQNALLNGAREVSQGEANRIGSEVQNEKDYIIIPEGKMMIIELKSRLNFKH